MYYSRQQPNENTKMHDIMDEKVNVYVENEKFTSLLSEYYMTGDERCAKEMWTIAYRCACNIIKRKQGKWLNWQEVSDIGLDAVAVLFARIKNRNKYPEGYPVYNLPTTMNYITISLLYSEKAKFHDKITTSLDDLYETEEWDNDL